MAFKEKVKVLVRITVNGKDFDVYTAVKDCLNYTTLPSGKEIKLIMTDSERVTR